MCNVLCWPLFMHVSLKRFTWRCNNITLSQLHGDWCSVNSDLDKINENQLYLYESERYISFILSTKNLRMIAIPHGLGPRLNMTRVVLWVLLRPLKTWTWGSDGHHEIDRSKPYNSGPPLIKCCWVYFSWYVNSFGPCLKEGIFFLGQVESHFVSSTCYTDEF